MTINFSSRTNSENTISNFDHKKTEKNNNTKHTNPDIKKNITISHGQKGILNENNVDNADTTEKNSSKNLADFFNGEIVDSQDE